MKNSLRSLLATIVAAFSGCQKAPVSSLPDIPDPPIESDVLAIEHMRFGLEQFEIEEALCNLYEADSGVWEFVIYVSTGEAIKRSSELAEIIDPNPNFEATAILNPSEIELHPGKQILQEAGYDYSRDENLSNLYYFNHNSIEVLTIRLMEVTDDWIDAEVTGIVVINGSNGVDPDSKISLRTRFKRKKDLRRGIS